jgi:Tfp pilus assembly protein PilV
MLSITSNNKGITIIEGLVAILITSIGLMALLSMQSPTWRLSGKAEYMGRGASILSKELSAWELYIMNPCNAVTAGTTNWNRFTSGSTSTWNVNTSNQGAAQSGDATFTVTTVLTDISPAGIPAGTAWRVDVTVNWAGNASALSESVVVTRQITFRDGC